MTRTAAEPSLEARTRIMRAAEKLFAQKGYAATAVHEITDAAGVNRALLYYYFEDKHSLYASVLHEGNEEFVRMLDRGLSAPGTYADRLAAMVRGHLDLLWDRGDMARVVHRCLLDGHEEEFGLVERFKNAIGRMEQFFREASESGEFRVTDPEITARTFLGPSFCLSLWSERERSRFSREQMANSVTEQLLAGFITRP